MPLDHSNATATISVTGLALGCYNPQSRNWEVAFLRHPQHTLTIDVTTDTGNGPSTMFFRLDDEHQIRITTEDGIVRAKPLYKPMQVFDRRATGSADVDLEDLRWVVDFETELNGGQPVPLKAPEVPVTSMLVENPLLYADRLNFIDDDQKLIRAADGSDVRVFGKLSEGCKADLQCQNGGAVVVTIEGPLGFSVRLPHTAGSTHKILIDNTCPPRAGEPPSSDFKLYYSLIDNTAGDKFDLKPVNKNVSGQGAVCNKSILGVSDHLFPLP